MRAENLIIVRSENMRPLKEIDEFVREFTKEAPATYETVLRMMLDTTANRGELSAAYSQFIRDKTNKEKEKKVEQTS